MSPSRKTSEDFGARIKAARVAASLSQGALAALVGRKQSTINDWEHGNSEPSLAHVHLISRATGKTPAWLAFGAEDETATERRKAS